MIAALVLLLAAAVIFTPGIVRILREQDAKCQALIDDALEPQPDYEANVAAFDRLGVTR